MVPLRGIAKELNLSFKSILKICEKLNLNYRELKGGKKAIIRPTEKICTNNDGKGCGIKKPIDQFRCLTRTRNSGNSYIYYSTYCLECEPKYNLVSSRNHYKNNKQIYRMRNKRIREKMKTNPVLKLRARVSGAVLKQLRKYHGSKQNNSIMKYLPYSIKELVDHLEAQFKEPGNEWMNWENYGNYKFGKGRKWHIDHIVPQSALPFDSMEHPNFLKCWALENLRPLDAVENISKGNKIININK